MRSAMKIGKLFVMTVCLTVALLCVIALDRCVFVNVFSIEQFDFNPESTEVHEDGYEYYVTDVAGGVFTDAEGEVPVAFCKYGNMIAVNVVGFEKPLLWKVGNKIVVLTGYEGGSTQRARSECRIVVMDADEGELSVAHPTADDMLAIESTRHVEVRDHVVLCYNEEGSCHEIRVQLRHRNNILTKAWSRYLVSSVAERGRSRREKSGRKWVDPNTGLEWMYVEMADGVKIENTRTRGCAVSPMPKGVAVIPEYINGRPVVCIGDNVILHCNVESVRIPKTVMRFSERASYSLSNSGLKRIEVDVGNRCFQSKDGLLYDVTGRTLLCVPNNVSEVRVSEGVTNIAASAFDHCCSLECVTLPASVKELGEWAFFMSSVKIVRFLGDAPKVPAAHLMGIYSMTPTALTTYANKDAKGWRVNGRLPRTWNERPIVFR